MIGRKLGHHTILGHLGSGGMGDVYLAEDEKLHRKVALKVLPAETAGSPDRLSRFRREAESVAALSHPSIITIFSVEEEDGVHFMTMEWIEGETLADRIPPEGLPLPEVLRLGVPIADALAAAHEAGVVHRDLKPQNIMVDRRGNVRVMDFGLARLEPRGASRGTEAPTEALTREGTRLGTTAYMPPEQVQGKRADHRADLFAAGVVLYEMATGRRPFTGGSAAEVMSAILRDDPPPAGSLRPGLPPSFDEIIRRCLHKDPSKRYQRAADLREDLRQLVEATSASGREAAPAGGPARLPWRTLAIIGSAVALALAGWLLRPGAPPGETPPAAPAAPREAWRVSQLTFGAELEEWPAWSPGGDRLAYAAEVEGFRKIFVREIGGGALRQVTRGSRDDVQPAWSPDGGRLIFVRSSRPGGKMEPDDLFGDFYTAGDIWQVDLATGEESLLVENAFSPAWSPDGRLVAFDAQWAGPPRIWTSDARGRNPRQVTTDSSEAVTHTEPAWSPDGSKIAFRRREKSKSDIHIVNLDSGEAVPVTDDSYRDLHPGWMPDGEAIVFSSFRGGGQNVWLQPVGPGGRPSGPAEQLTAGAGNDIQIAVDPRGSRIAFVVLGINSDLWRLPLDPETGRPSGEPQPLVATTREDSRGSWSPEGSRLAFNSDRLGDMNIWLKTLADGSERALTTGAGGDYQPQWSPDGSSLVFFSSREGSVDIWKVEVATGRLSQLTSDPSVDEDPFWSPDGRRIAFQSDRGGRLEVWVIGADGSDPRRPGDHETSGHFMRWSDDGRFVTHRAVGASGTSLALQPADGSAATILPELAGAGFHISYSPDRSRILDVSGHRILKMFSAAGGEGEDVFEFDSPDVRIDYPVWSPDGRWVVFDRAVYQGADVWMLERATRARP